VFPIASLRCVLHFFKLSDKPRGKAYICSAGRIHSTGCLQTLVLQINHGKQHFKSYHGKYGLASVVLAWAAAFGGALSFRRLGILQRFPADIQPVLKAAHRSIGPIVWFLALYNSLLGLQTKGAGPRHSLHFWQGVGIIIMGVSQLTLLYGTDLVSLPDRGLAKIV
jgi:hypothetical protein